MRAHGLVGLPEVVRGPQRDACKDLKDRLPCVILDHYASEVHRPNRSLRLNKERREAIIGSELVPGLGQVVVDFSRPMASHKKRESCHESVSTRACLGPSALLEILGSSDMHHPRSLSEQIDTGLGRRGWRDTRPINRAANERIKQAIELARQRVGLRAMYLIDWDCRDRGGAAG